MGDVLIKSKAKQKIKIRRKKHIRKKIFGSQKCPRISIFKSLKNIYIQAINDYQGHTIVSYSLKHDSLFLEHKKNVFLLGQHFGRLLGKQGISSACLDRNGYQYAQKIMRISDGIKKSGILM